MVGVDNSPQMIAAAKEQGVDARCASGEALPFDQEFDAVFSNAALHWMSDQDAVLRGVHRALKPGGRFVAECGGQGNIAAIRVALLAVLTAHGIPAERIENNRFFGAAEYRARLESQGFLVRGNHADTAPNAAAFRDGRMARNLPRAAYWNYCRTEKRPAAIEQIVTLLRPFLCDREGHWTADYVRLRFLARRP